MENMPTTQELAQAMQTMQNELRQAISQISNLQNALNQANQANAELKQDLSVSRRTNVSLETTKIKRPDAFKGKGSVQSWAVHMDNYLRDTPLRDCLHISASYLEGSAHEWWIVHQSTEEGKRINDWSALRAALIKRFEPLNKEKVARDKLAKWKQVKDVSSFNEDFLKIILDIPHISSEEQIDRYTRGLKPYIWKELCTRDYTELSEAMKDAERVESAHRRLNKTSSSARVNFSNQTGPVPMEIGNITLKKLTAAEREQCRKEGRCFRCRQKGHTSRNCPKGQRN